MSDEPDEMDEVLQEEFLRLRREYVEEAPSRLDQLRTALAAIRAGDPDAPTALKSQLHQLAGSGGSYGFPAISDASRHAEEWLAEHPEPDAAGLKFLANAIRGVATAFAAAAKEVRGER